MAAAARTSDIARRRAARSAVALALLALAGPAAGQVGPRLVSLYPLSRTTADAGDVQALLDVALHRLAQRTGNVALGTPLVVRAACGPAASAAPDCLARLAGEGLVVRATVHFSGSALLVTLHAVDGAGRSTGPVSTAVDTFIQSAEPLVNALQLLVDEVFAGDRRRAREKPDMRAPEPPPPALAAAAVSRPPPARRWMRAAGPWVTGAGAVLVAGGLAVSTTNHSLSEELEDKLAAGRLTAADLDSYDRVDRYNTLSALLFASGGALTLGGVALWTAPLPRGPAVAGVAGRF